MKKQFFVFILFLFVTISSYADFHKSTVLRVGVLKNFPPIYSVSETGIPTGFGVETFEQIAELVGINYEYKVYDNWGKLINDMKNGDVDIVPNVGITKGREYMIFSVPVHTFHINYFYRAGDSIDEERINEYVIGVAESNYARRALKGKAKLKVFSNEHDLLLSLLAGQVDAIAYPGEIIVKTAEEAGLIDRIRMIEKPIVEIKRGVGLAPNRTDILGYFNSAIRDYVVTDSYAAVYKKWYKAKDKSFSKSQIVGVGATVVLLIILSFGFFHYLYTRTKNKELLKSLEETKKAKAELEESRKKMNLITDSIKDVFWLCTPDMGRMVYISPSFEDVWGVKVEELYENAELFSSCLHEDDRKRVMDYIGKNPNRIWDLEYRIVRPDGKVRWIKDRGFPVYEGDNVVYMAGAATDITRAVNAENQKKEQEQILIQQSRCAAMGEMVNAIAHQWRQPLNALGLIVQCMNESVKEENIDKQDFAEMSDKCEYLIDHMSQTINDFRDFFMPDTKKEAFSIIETVVEAFRLVDAQLNNKGIKYVVECVCPKSSVSILTCDQDFKCPQCEGSYTGFKGEFKQVILNVIQNSKDAIVETEQKEKFIKCNVLIEKYRCRIIIEDTGGGLEEKFLSRVFDPYFSTKGHSGTGIGLYMSKSIIENHFGGKIKLENFNQGARIVIEFPIDGGY